MIIEFGGEGPVILLLHGLMGRARTWWPVARWLVRYGRVIGLDARAHGRNPHRTAARTEDFVADAAETLRRVGMGPAVVIGHSMGALHARTAGGCMSKPGRCRFSRWRMSGILRGGG